MTTIGDLLNGRVYLSPHLEAVVTETKRINFKEYQRLVNQLAHFMLERKVEKGDRVAFLCKNTLPYPIIYLAAVKIGAIAVPINTRLKPDEVKWIVGHCEAKILFYERDFAHTVSFLKEDDQSVIKVQVDSENLEKLIGHYPDIEPEVQVFAHDPAIMIYTSGTTGQPKGVVSTHANVYAAALSNVNTLDMRYQDRFLFVTPLFHISGMMFIINALVRGMTLVLRPEFHPTQLWDVVEQEKITGMMSVPAMLNFMYETLKHTDRDIDSLRAIVCGGSLVPERMIRYFYDLGFSVVQVYGATEFTGAITYWTPDMGIENSGSVGKGVYLTEIRIVDPLTGEQLPPGEIGEIVVRGEQVFSGYWNQEEETQKVLKNGWYYTRDVGKLDENGFLYVIDRLRDMIICGGEKIFPAQVEPAILELEGVEEVAVVGVKHPVWNELPRAYVVKKENATITEREILAHVRQKLADYKLIDVQFIDKLPKNSMGKVLKYVLRDMANQQIMEEDILN